MSPSRSPTISPSNNPTLSPSKNPSKNPTSMSPTKSPSIIHITSFVPIHIMLFYLLIFRWIAIPESIFVAECLTHCLAVYVTCWFSYEITMYVWFNLTMFLCWWEACCTIFIDLLSVTHVTIQDISWYLWWCRLCVAISPSPSPSTSNPSVSPCITVWIAHGVTHDLSFHESICFSVADNGVTFHESNGIYRVSHGVTNQKPIYVAECIIIRITLDITIHIAKYIAHSVTVE